MKVIQDSMSFGEAIEALRKGKTVTREGWNGKGMFLVMNGGYKVDKDLVRPDTPINPAFLEKVGVEELQIQQHIDMWTAQKTLCVGWLASQMDIVARDWCIVDIMQE
jgi:hypothetical protein